MITVPGFKPRYTDARFVAWLQNRRNRRSAAYLFKDNFNFGTLASPRACVPGPGTLAVSDSDGVLSLAHGMLRYNGTSPSGPAGVHTGVLPRKAGRAFLFNCWNRNTGFVRAGFTSGGTPTDNALAAVIPSGNQVLLRAPSSSNTIYSYLLANSLNEVQFACVQRATGIFWFIREGGAEKQFDLAWVDNTSSANVGAYIGRGTTAQSSDASFGNFRLVDMPSPFDSDFGLAAMRAAAPSSGGSFAGLADGWTEFTWTPVLSQVCEISFRRSSDAYRWVVRCDQAAENLKLIEIYGGVETERATNIQTWTPGTPVRLVIHHAAGQIKVYSANTFKLSATSPSLEAETGVAVSGFTSGTDLVAWPLKVTLPNY